MTNRELATDTRPSILSAEVTPAKEQWLPHLFVALGTPQLIQNQEPITEPERLLAPPREIPLGNYVIQAYDAYNSQEQEFKKSLASESQSGAVFAKKEFLASLYDKNGLSLAGKEVAWHAAQLVCEEHGAFIPYDLIKKALYSFELEMMVSAKSEGTEITEKQLINFRSFVNHLTSYIEVNDLVSRSENITTPQQLFNQVSDYFSANATRFVTSGEQPELTELGKVLAEASYEHFIFPDLSFQDWEGFVKGLSGSDMQYDSLLAAKFNHLLDQERQLVLDSIDLEGIADGKLTIDDLLQEQAKLIHLDQQQEELNLLEQEARAALPAIKRTQYDLRKYIKGVKENGLLNTPLPLFIKSLSSKGLTAGAVLGVAALPATGIINALIKSGVGNVNIDTDNDQTSLKPAGKAKLLSTNSGNCPSQCFTIVHEKNGDTACVRWEDKAEREVESCDGSLGTWAYAETNWLLPNGTRVKPIAWLENLMGNDSGNGNRVIESRDPNPSSCPGNLAKIVPGDTLAQIARGSGVSLEEIIDANPQIRDPSKINAGQEICIPFTTYQQAHATALSQPAHRERPTQTPRPTDIPTPQATATPWAWQGVDTGPCTQELEQLAQSQGSFAKTVEINPGVISWGWGNGPFEQTCGIPNNPDKPLTWDILTENGQRINLDLYTYDLFEPGCTQALIEKGCVPGELIQPITIHDENGQVLGTFEARHRDCFIDIIKHGSGTQQTEITTFCIRPDDPNRIVKGKAEFEPGMVNRAQKEMPEQQATETPTPAPTISIAPESLKQEEIDWDTVIKNTALGVGLVTSFGFAAFVAGVAIRGRKNHVNTSEYREKQSAILLEKMAKDRRKKENKRMKQVTAPVRRAVRAEILRLLKQAVTERIKETTRKTSIALKTTPTRSQTSELRRTALQRSLQRRTEQRAEEPSEELFPTAGAEENQPQASQELFPRTDEMLDFSREDVESLF
ncbi:LysM peptidoglycan-binding domain-containing protein [Patescibacteria group bacterium]